MALQISLGDGEMIVVNGAVLRAVGRMRLKVENQVTIMRSKDVMKPEEAVTPARRLYYTCMLAYIDEPNREKHHRDLVPLLADLASVFQVGDGARICLDFTRLVASQDHYQALVECRKMIAYEGEVFSRMDVGIAA